MRIILFILTFASAPASADIFGFETPSGNIECVVGLERDYADIDCTIIQRGGAPALPRPANCAADWGHVFSMGDTGPVQMACHQPPSDGTWSDKAEYGVTGTFNKISCTSETTGFRCSNASGHGFFLSRREQTVF